jgi:hypothetical protein
MRVRNIEGGKMVSPEVFHARAGVAADSWYGRGRLRFNRMVEGTVELPAKRMT